MFDLIKKELSIHGIAILPNGVQSKGKEGVTPVGVFTLSLKEKAKKAYYIAEKLWDDLGNDLSLSSEKESECPEGFDGIFISAMQGLKRMIFRFSRMKNFRKVSELIDKALLRDINSFSYKLMSKIIEYRLSLEWVSHIINKHLYLRFLIRRLAKHTAGRKTAGKGVSGPFSNLDLPMEERVFTWGDIEGDVDGRDEDIKHQSRYSLGLEGYNNPEVNEGWVWREIRNEPYMFDDQDENPYPHRDLLWRS